MTTKEIIVSDSNLFFPKDETQIKLSTDVDNSYKETVNNIISKSFGVVMAPEEFIPEPMGKIYVSSGCLKEGEPVSKSIIDIDCLIGKQTLNEYLEDKFKLNDNDNNNESVKYKYLYNKHLNNTYSKISADLDTYSKLFDQGFAKKNTRLKADEEITKSGNTLLKAYPFILGVGAGVNTINLQMVVRSFIIPMERVDLNTNLSVFKYPEWFMNKKAIIDAVEDTIYISGNASSIVFYGSKTNEFGYNPADYDLKLSNYNIVNFYNRHNKLVATNNSGSTNS